MASKVSVQITPTPNKILAWLPEPTYTELSGISLEDPLKVELFDLTFQTRRKSWIHGGAAGQDNVFVELGPCVDVGSLDGVEKKLSNADALNVDQMGLEEGLGGTETFTSDLDHTTVW